MELDSETIAGEYFDHLQYDFIEWEKHAFNKFPEKFPEGRYGINDLFQILLWAEELERGYQDSAIEDLFFFSQNDLHSVKSTVDRAINQSDLEKQIETLIELDGISVPLASSILHFIQPDRHVICDSTVLKGLIDVRLMDADRLPGRPTPETYLQVRQICKDLSETAGISFIDIDRALWLHKHNKKWNLSGMEAIERLD
ncbi:hypothetical protein [Haloarcula sp. Atlit-7R]|uniref:hypothetical protein n=1 Tax=Haloarcula sp. Atlit-7R TaxID=2282125 RepID=UPI0011C374B0|nr:hypothetical protein [Haloarcula sp. Atlit-7R]